MAKDEWIRITGEDLYKGIGLSPHTGIADMRNMNISEVPGTAMINKALKRIFQGNVADQTFSVQTNPQNLITLADNDYTWTDSNGDGVGSNKRAFTVSSTGTLPGGFSANTVYYLKISNEASRIYEVYTDYDLTSQVTITSSGTGTHTISSVDIGQVVAVFDDNYGDEIYFADDNDVIWKVPTTVSAPPEVIGGNSSSGVDDIAVWKDYLFVFAGANIDVYGPLSGSPSWSNAWKNTMSSTASSHFALVGQDDALYICNNKNVASLIEKVGQTFAPGDSATYTFNTSALDLPFETERLTELGAELAISTEDGRLYFWDRSSDSFRLPVIFGEQISEMVTVNNLIYVFQSNGRTISVTNGTSITDIKVIPDYLVDDFEAGTTMSFGRPTRVGDKILFGVYNSIGASAIYSLDINTNALVVEHVISTGSYGTLNDALILKFIGHLAGNSNYFVFWQDPADGETNGVDTWKSTTFVDNLLAKIETAYYTLGTRNIPRTLQEFEVEFDTELSTTTDSEDVKLSYRYNLADSWTTVATLKGEDNANETVYNFQLGALTGKAIQFKVETETAGGASRTLCRIKELRFK